MLSGRKARSSLLGALSYLGSLTLHGALVLMWLTPGLMMPSRDLVRSCWLVRFRDLARSFVLVLSEIRARSSCMVLSTFSWLALFDWCTPRSGLAQHLMVLSGGVARSAHRVLSLLMAQGQLGGLISWACPPSTVKIYGRGGFSPVSISHHTCCT